jgi:hypothetical protein
MPLATCLKKTRENPQTGYRSWLRAESSIPKRKRLLKPKEML